MKTLITGGAGFIGSYLAEKLVKNKEEVFVIDNLSTGSLSNIKHLKDFANFHFIQGIIKLMANPKANGEIFNIGSNEEITIENLAKKIKKLTNSKSQLVYIPYEQAYGSGFEDMQKRVPDLTKISKTVGYKPKHNLDQTLQKIIEYFINS